MMVFWRVVEDIISYEDIQGGGPWDPLDWAKNGFLGAIGEELSSQLELLFFPPEGQSEAVCQRVKFRG